MTELSDLITPATVVSGVVAANKKNLLQQLAAIAERAWGVDAKRVAERLAEREKLGSTGFGGGIALPHGRIDSIPHVAGVFVRLDRPVDFGAIDELPVDLVFMLLSPPDAGADHLKALASASRRLRDRGFAAKLRGAGSTDALYALLTGVEARDAA
jgi:PTS system nitrogen regulatory IIA component